MSSRWLCWALVGVVACGDANTTDDATGGDGATNEGRGGGAGTSPGTGGTSGKAGLAGAGGVTDSEGGGGIDAGGAAGAGGGVGTGGNAGAGGAAGAGGVAGAGAGGGAGAPAHPGIEVFVGGTYSKGNLPGMHDLAVAANRAQYVAKGGKLYVHEMGWTHTSKDEQKAIAAAFPDPPIYETSQPQAVGSLRTYLAPFWPGGAYVTCINYISDANEIIGIKSQVGALTHLLGPYFSPNGVVAGKPLWDTPFSDKMWDAIRAAAKAGGALCTDAPPAFYLAQPETYKQFIADEMTWAHANGVVLVAAVFPRESKDFWSDTQKYIHDLAARKATPNVWAINAYYSSTDDGRLMHPLGSETETPDCLYTALQTLLTTKKP